MSCACNSSSDISNIIRAAEDFGNSRDAFLGLNPFSVTLVEVLTVGGDRPGHGGTRARTDTRLTIYDGYGANYPGDGYLNPTVRQVKQNEIILSQGRLQDKDFKIGPLVQPYILNKCDGTNITLGLDSNVLDPSPAGTKEVYFLIKGPGIPSSGSYFKTLYTVEDDAVAFCLFVRATGIVVPL